MIGRFMLMCRYAILEFFFCISKLQHPIRKALSTRCSINRSHSQARVLCYFILTETQDLKSANRDFLEKSGKLVAFNNCKGVGLTVCYLYCCFIFTSWLFSFITVVFEQNFKSHTLIFMRQ